MTWPLTSDSAVSLSNEPQNRRPLLYPKRTSARSLFKSAKCQYATSRLRARASRCQRGEQHIGFFKVMRVETFGERVVHGSKQFPNLPASCSCYAKTRGLAQFLCARQEFPTYPGSFAARRST